MRRFVETGEHALHGALEVGHVHVLLVAPAGEDGGLVGDVRELGARQPRGAAGEHAQVDVRREGLRARVDAQDRLAPRHVGRRDVDLTIEAAGPQERRIEVLQAVGGAHHDHVLAAAEPVELDEELIQRLVVLAVEAAATLRPDGVELVDEDDRRSVLAGLLEQLADARGAETREHLDERGGARRVEVRARLLGDRLGEQRLAGTGRAVEEDPPRHARAEPGEAAVLAQELDDLLELRLGLVDAGHVPPGDHVDRLLLDRRRLHARHEADGHHQQDHDDPEEHHRHPDDDGVLELLPAVGDDRAQEVLPVHLRTISGLPTPVNG